MELLSSFGKGGVKLHLIYRDVDIEDVSATSKYFDVTEFPKIFTAGKNSFAFNGTPLLRDKSEILIECLDSAGQSMYLEYAVSKEGQFTDASKFVVGIHVYDEQYNGPAKIVLVGTTAKGETVRWIGNLTIDKTVANTSKVRFVNRPLLEVRSLLYPVIDTSRAAVEYPPPPLVDTATGTCTIVSGVSDVTMTVVGSGYTTATVVFDNSGTKFTVSAEAVADVEGGSVVRIRITNPGAGYLKAPKVVIKGGHNKKAAAIASISSQVNSVSVTKPGLGYAGVVPEVIFTPVNGAGQGASATAHLAPDGNSVAYVTMDPEGGGEGYVYVPKVSFTPPSQGAPPNMNVTASLSASFITYAGNPTIDFNKKAINPKQTDIDYRLVITSSAFSPLVAADFGSAISPTKVFNSQMEGQIATLHITKIKRPQSSQELSVNLTSSFVIKKVLDGATAQLTEPFYYAIGKNQFVANITEGRCFVFYRFVLYNTAQDSAKLYTISDTLQVPMKDSYAEIVYRNIKCFTGYVARHKLYRKSAFAPGDFQLISDELLLPTEILADQVTFNRFYDKMGVFYNQPHVNKYWFSEISDFTLRHSTFPINSMKIEMTSFDVATGDRGVILKNDTLGGVNDNIYRPYNSAEYNNLSGSSYNSNFIHLKKDVLYVLSADIVVEKDMDTDAKVEFGFTSSLASIKKENTYDQLHFRWKLGEITISDSTTIKYFKETQKIYFTPQEDYYGTILVVPHQCSPTLSNLSMKVYGDHGFSPDCNDIRIPFETSTPNEAFEIKSELLDINSTVVYSKLKTVQSFDEGGASLLGKESTGDINAVISVGGGGSVTVVGQPYFPDLTLCDNTTRMVGWHAPGGDANDGKLCYTNVAQLYISSSDYIALHDFSTGAERIARSIAVQYDFANDLGRKIFIDQFGTKETFP